MPGGKLSTISEQSQELKLCQEVCSCIYESTNFRLDRVLYTLHLNAQEKSQRFIISDQRKKKNQHRMKEMHKNHRVMETTDGKELRKVNIDGDNYTIMKCDGNVLTVQDLGVCPCLPHENNHCSYRDCDVCPYRYYCPCPIGRRSGVACSHLHFLEKFKRIRASKNISSDEEDSSYEDDTPTAPPMSPTPSVIDLDDFPAESRPVTPPTASRNDDPPTQTDWNEFNQAVDDVKKAGQSAKVQQQRKAAGSSSVKRLISHKASNATRKHGVPKAIYSDIDAPGVPSTCAKCRGFIQGEDDRLITCSNCHSFMHFTCTRGNSSKCPVCDMMIEHRE